MQDALDKLPPELRDVFAPFLDDHQRLQRENALLREQVRLLLIDKYGPRSEKLSDEQLELLQGEPSVVGDEVDQEADRTGPPPKRRKRPQKDHPGRAELPAHLERREVIIRCPVEDCSCGQCGQEKPIFGYERSEELAVDPAYYYVKVILREKRACPQHPEEGVSCAPCPEKIIPKSKFSDEMVVDVLVKKYGDHLPAYRQSMILDRDAGIEISRKTLVDVIMKTGRLMQALIPTLKDDLLNGGYIQADETRVPCQSARVRGKNHCAYMWEYSRPYGPVVFDFQMGRDRAGPEEFLQGFEGILQSDGYSTYNKLGEGITYAGCWAHARREFHRAHKLQPNDPRPLEILGLIAQFYAVEKRAREEKATDAQRLMLRQDQSRQILDTLEARILGIRAEADLLPSSQLAKACDYAIGQWSRLKVFLEHGKVEPDNNWCENAIRPLVVGRKNWLHIGSEEAGPRVAAIASILETCKRLGINVRSYLLDVLPKLPEWPAKRVAELGPVAWKAHQTGENPPILPQGPRLS